MSNFDPENLHFSSGFIPESSNVSSSERSRSAANFAVRPVTAKILLNSDSEKNGETTHFKFQDVSLHSVVLVGKVSVVNLGKRSVTFSLDDSTEVITVRKVLPEGTEVAPIKDGQYVRVYGEVSTQEKKDEILVFAQRLEVIENYNIITQHLLEVMQSYLHFRK